MVNSVYSHINDVGKVVWAADTDTHLNGNKYIQFCTHQVALLDWGTDHQTFLCPIFIKHGWPEYFFFINRHVASIKPHASSIIWCKTWQMRMKWSVPNAVTVISFKMHFPNKTDLSNTSHHSLCFLFAAVESNIMYHWQLQPNSIKLMTGLAYDLNLISKISFPQLFPLLSCTKLSRLHRTDNTQSLSPCLTLLTLWFSV